MPARLIKSIDTKNYGGETIRIGDLNTDGAPELLIVQSYRPTREISCLTAVDIFGAVLWQKGVPSKDNGTIYSDLPVQIYDWDNDGRNEVLWIGQANYLEYEAHSYDPLDKALVCYDIGVVRQDMKRYVERALKYGGNAVMHILDGNTGEEKHSLLLPAPADDCFLFANLTGKNGKNDLIVKDRYWNVWGIDHMGSVLWQWSGQTGHFPTVSDVDGDGMDEVFVGSALIDHDGQVLWETKNFTGHQDTVCVVSNGDELRLLSLDDKLRCLNIRGEELWNRDFAHGQHLLPGQFKSDSPIQFAVIDERHNDEADTLHLINLDGNELWRRRTRPNGNAGSHIRLIDWSGGLPCIVLFNANIPNWPSRIYDGDGDVIEELYFQRADLKKPDSVTYTVGADAWGDSRHETLLTGREGVCIYANTAVKPDVGLNNFTYYNGIG